MLPLPHPGQQTEHITAIHRTKTSINDTANAINMCMQNTYDTTHRNKQTKKPTNDTTRRVLPLTPVGRPTQNGYVQHVTSQHSTGQQNYWQTARINTRTT